MLQLSAWLQLNTFMIIAKPIDRTDVMPASYMFSSFLSSTGAVFPLYSLMIVVNTTDIASLRQNGVSISAGSFTALSGTAFSTTKTITYSAATYVYSTTSKPFLVYLHAYQTNEACATFASTWLASSATSSPYCNAAQIAAIANISVPTGRCPATAATTSAAASTTGAVSTTTRPATSTVPATTKSAAATTTLKMTSVMPPTSQSVSTRDQSTVISTGDRITTTFPWSSATSSSAGEKQSCTNLNVHTHTRRA